MKNGHEPERTVRRATLREKLDMLTLLRSMSTAENGNEDERVFVSGWDFERIAKAVSPALHRAHAAGAATGAGLKVAPAPDAPAKGPTALLAVRVAELEAQLEALKTETSARLEALEAFKREFD